MDDTIEREETLVGGFSVPAGGDLDVEATVLSAAGIVYMYRPLPRVSGTWSPTILPRLSG